MSPGTTTLRISAMGEGSGLGLGKKSSCSTEARHSASAASSFVMRDTCKVCNLCDGFVNFVYAGDGEGRPSLKRAGHRYLWPLSKRLLDEGPPSLAKG